MSQLDEFGRVIKSDRSPSRTDITTDNNVAGMDVPGIDPDIERRQLYEKLQGKYNHKPVHMEPVNTSNHSDSRDRDDRHDRYIHTDSRENSRRYDDRYDKHNDRRYDDRYDRYNNRHYSDSRSDDRHSRDRYDDRQYDAQYSRGRYSRERSSEQYVRHRDTRTDNRHQSDYYQRSRHTVDMRKHTDTTPFDKHDNTIITATDNGSNAVGTIASMQQPTTTVRPTNIHPSRMQQIDTDTTQIEARRRSNDIRYNNDTTDKQHNKHRSVLSSEIPELYSIHKATVRSIKPFGCFVSLNSNRNIQGLVHISQLSPVKVDSVDKVVDINQTVYVKLISIDTDTNKLAFSMKYVNQSDGSDLDPLNEQLNITKQQHNNKNNKQQYNDTYKPTIDTTRVTSNVTCANCGAIGHTANECLNTNNKQYKMIDVTDITAQQALYEQIQQQTQLNTVDQTTIDNALKLLKQATDERKALKKQYKQEKRSKHSKHKRSKHSKKSHKHKRKRRYSSSDSLSSYSGSSYSSRSRSRSRSRERHRDKHKSHTDNVTKHPLSRDRIDIHDKRYDDRYERSSRHRDRSYSRSPSRSYSRSPVRQISNTELPPLEPASTNGA